MITVRCKETGVVLFAGGSKRYIFCKLISRYSNKTLVLQQEYTYFCTVYIEQL